jgi:hypothetical protein
VVEKAVPGTLLHAANESFSMKEVATVIHRGLGLKGEPSSLPLKEARRFSPIADNLVRNSAISGEIAKRNLGWSPVHDSLLKTIEHQAFVSRREIGSVPDPCFKQEDKRVV